MRTLGLIGGMSWESTAEYYALINREIRSRLGGHHSARLLLYSVDFAEIEELQRAGDWDRAAAILVDAAGRLATAGADGLVLCTNTMHKVADALQESVEIPLLHIVEATGRRLVGEGISRVGLLGTRFTMEEAFYRERLARDFDLDVIVPPVDDRRRVDRIIYDELCHGEIREGSRREYVRIIRELGGAGAQGVILGCTEIGLLVKEKDSPLSCFDTTRIHAEAAVDFALGRESAT